MFFRLYIIRCYVSVPKKHCDFNCNLHLNAGNELTLTKSLNVSVLGCLSGKTKNKQTEKHKNLPKYNANKLERNMQNLC